MKKFTTLLLICYMALMFASGLTACAAQTCKHIYDNACDTICNECEEIRTITHDWSAADCDSPKTCKVCGATEGEKLGHTPNEDDGNCLTAITCKNCPEILMTAQAEHDFTGEWQKSEDGHYHVCANAGCTAQDEIATHSDTASACDICGFEFAATLNPDTKPTATMPDVFTQTTNEDNAFLNDYLYTYATQDGYAQIPASFKFIITNHSGKEILLKSVKIRIANTDGTSASVASREISVVKNGNETTLVFNGAYDEIGTTINAPLTAQEQYTAYVLALPLTDNSAFVGKTLQIVFETADGEFISYSMDPKYLASANMSDGEDIYNWVSGKSYTFRLSTTCNAGCSFNNSGICEVCGSLCEHEADDDNGNCATAIRCKYCKTVLTEAKEHDFTGEWMKDTDGHYHICQNEGCTAKDTKIGHNGGEATCLMGKLCEACGYEYDTNTNPDNHDSNETFASYFDNHTHAFFYTCCNTVASTEAHNGKADCSTYAYCDICNMSYGSLDYDNHISKETISISIDGEKHGVYAACCNTLLLEEEHNATKTTANCQLRATCDACGNEFGDLDPNTHNNELTIIEFIDSTYHRVDYLCCDAESKTEEHTFVDDECACGKRQITAVSMSAEQLQTAVKELLATAETDIIVVLAADADATMFSAITAALSATVDPSLDHMELVHNYQGTIGLTISGAKTVPEYAFYVDEYVNENWRAGAALRSVTLTDATTIEEGAFFSCAMKSFSAPKAIAIEGGTLSGCMNLTDVYLPSVQTLGIQAFSECYALKTISLPECVDLGSSAFVMCDALETVYAPKATNLGPINFMGCKSLTKVTLGSIESVNQRYDEPSLFDIANDTKNIDLVLSSEQKVITYDSGTKYWTATEEAYKDSVDHQNNSFMGYTFKSVTFADEN